jgi:SAM-dependent methyltransferase
MNQRTIIDDVRDQYADVAQGSLSNDSSSVRSIASAFGYSEAELNQLPSEANMGLSCGNPLALAGIRDGEVVVDLGCGGGMDVFLAARKVGSSGRVIGVDMTGFASVVITDTACDLNAYALASNHEGCCGNGTRNAEGLTDAGDGGSAFVATDATSHHKSLHDGLASMMGSFDANAFAASVRVHALKKSSVQSDKVILPLNVLPSLKENSMKTVQVYDKPMCCSTGVCGPEVDPVLPQFAADLDWLKSQGHNVQRYNLAQQPQAFIENQSVHQVLSTEGTDSLPVVVIDGEIVSRKVYPTREALTALVGGSQAKQLLPVAKASGGCCGTSGCC